MNILFLNTEDFGGGASVAVWRIFKEAQRRGLNCKLLCRYKYTDDPNVYKAPDYIPAKERLRRSLKSVQNPSYYNLPATNREVLKTSADYFSFDKTDVYLNNQELFGWSDIIFINWTAGFLGFYQNTKVFDSKQVLLRLADETHYTGGCHYAFDCTGYQNRCGRCPQMGSANPKDASYLNHRVKSKVWRKLAPHVVAISEWQAKRCRESSLLGNFPVSVIPNGIDTGQFRPVHQSKFKSKCQIPDNDYVLLFGAVNSASYRKGGPLMKELIRLLPDTLEGNKLTFVSFGKKSDDLPERVIQMGECNAAALIEAYSAADVFIMPSIQEAFGQTTIEAMACGCPVVAHNTGGMADVIRHKFDGYLTELYSAESFRQGIEWIMHNNSDNEVGAKARQRIKEQFHIEDLFSRYLALFNKMTDRS